MPECGKLYAIEDKQHMFHRVETEELSPIGCHGISEQAQVFYVDQGLRETINTDMLYELTEEFASVRFQV